MTKRSRKSDELDAALRAEPHYRELVRLLKRQAPAQKARTEIWLNEQAAKEEGSTVSSDKKFLEERIIHLKQKERLPWPKISARLEAEGFPRMTAGAVRKRYERSGKSPTKRETTPLRKVTTPSPVEGFAPLPAAYVEPLRRLIREELCRRPAEPAPSILDSTEDRPTPRPRVKRKLAGKKVTFPGTRIDANLATAFDAERRRLQLSASELLEIIIWRAFGKPLLSYEPLDEK